jgi:flavin-dependent dehydrogenase
VTAGAFAVIGGNVAGLSAAFHLARKGCRVTVYERGVWEKPCGGGISLAFARHLNRLFGLSGKGFQAPPRSLRIAFQTRQSALLPPLFAVVSRYEMQKQLMERISRHPLVDVVLQTVGADDTRLFTPQTVLATGSSALTRRLLPAGGNGREYALALKVRGKTGPGMERTAHLISMKSRINGYGWIFFEADGSFNMGIGGLISRSRLKEEFELFRQETRLHQGCTRLETDGAGGVWKIPIARQPDLQPVAFCHAGTEFIGVGDVLGLAHPILAAGIEPAWQSGRLLAESYLAEKKALDAGRYRRLLRKNLALTSRKPVDRAAAAAFRMAGRPATEKPALWFLRLAREGILRSLNRYPWFAMVHDGSQPIPVQPKDPPPG